MNRIIIVLFLSLLVLSSSSQTYYIVRHAEKATAAPNMSSDVPLTEAGKARAEALKDILSNKKIAYIFSTNTIRTKSTAQPTADQYRIAIETYSPRPDSLFISLLRSKKKNTLIVGHSNTVDDIVNMLCGETQLPGDLKDTEYDNLFIVEKKGKKLIFQQKKYGKLSD